MPFVNKSPCQVGISPGTRTYREDLFTGGDRVAEPEILPPMGLHPRGAQEPPVVSSEHLSFPVLRPQCWERQHQSPRPEAQGASAERGRGSHWRFHLRISSETSSGHSVCNDTQDANTQEPTHLFQRQTPGKQVSTAEPLEGSLTRLLSQEHALLLIPQVTFYLTKCLH